MADGVELLAGYVHGHKIQWGKARAYQGGTALAVAHDFLGTDNRLVAYDRQGKEYPATYCSSGAGRGGLGLLDAEFAVPADQFLECLFQFRPFELAEITDIALQPRPAGKPISTTEAPSKPEARPSGALSAPDHDIDTDGDGLSDYQEIHKYRTDPKKVSTAGDGVPDGDRQRRREFTYTIRSVVKVMQPVNLAECLNDDYQDVHVLARRTSGSPTITTSRWR